MSHDFWVSIHGERGEEWKRIAGTNHFPVRSPIASVGELPGIGETLVYLLALDQMEPEVLARIVEHLSRKFDMTPEESKAELEKHGTIPILAEDCGMIIHNPQRWIHDEDDD